LSIKQNNRQLVTVVLDEFVNDLKNNNLHLRNLRTDNANSIFIDSIDIVSKISYSPSRKRREEEKTKANRRTNIKQQSSDLI